jgi:anti-sigma regulatory factor (Ser/Thr protein kinase)
MFIEVNESSQTGETRRKAVEYAEDLCLDENRRGAVALAATEMATNLVKHAVSGRMLLQPMRENGRSGLRLIAVDRGPGIGDMNAAFTDGHSTAGSMGTGLGAIRRLSDVFEIYSAPGVGTVLRAEFWQGTENHSSTDATIQVGTVSEPITGEEVCGDGWGVRIFPDSVVLMVVDGLGHGLGAAEAAREAEQVLAEATDSGPLAILQNIHGALKKTRGAAVAVARIRTQQKLVTYAGVGNIGGSIVSPGACRSMASHNGTSGHNVPRVQEFTYPWDANSILIMHSDGLTSRWDLERYPGIWSKHPSLIATVLHRDFKRGRDDVTVLAAKHM